jgi:hypothetical protein
MQLQFEALHEELVEFRKVQLFLANYCLLSLLARLHRSKDLKFIENTRA